MPKAYAGYFLPGAFVDPYEFISKIVAAEGCDKLRHDHVLYLFDEVRRLRDLIDRRFSELLHEPIKVWRFEHANPVLQALSTNGGDEDWLAVVPQAYSGHFVPWLEGESFGCSGVEKHQLLTGDVAYIGSHA